MNHRVYADITQQKCRVTAHVGRLVDTLVDCIGVQSTANCQPWMLRNNTRVDLLPFIQVCRGVIDHLFNEFTVVVATLFIITNEVSQLGLLVLECVVQLFDLTHQVRFLRRQAFPVRFHCYMHHTQTDRHRHIQYMT